MINNWFLERSLSKYTKIRIFFDIFIFHYLLIFDTLFLRNQVPRPLQWRFGDFCVLELCSYTYSFQSFFVDFLDSAIMAFILCFETICVSVLKPAEPCRLLVTSVRVYVGT